MEPNPNGSRPAPESPAEPLMSKGRPIEERLDLYFFRPLGLRVAQALFPTPISPNQVTLAGLALGLVAGHLFFYANATLNLLGFALFVLSDILDSADGQLARMRRSTSRIGRILDGLADNIRFVGLYLHLIARLVDGGWGIGAVLLFLAAGFSHSLQSTAADFVRNAFLRLGMGGKGELDLAEEIAVQGGPLKRLAGMLYRHYVRNQEVLFPRTVALVRSCARALPAPDVQCEYRERQEKLLPLTAWIAQNVRFGLVLVTAGLGWPAGFAILTLGPLNLVLLVLLVLHERNSAIVHRTLIPLDGGLPASGSAL